MRSFYILFFLYSLTYVYGLVDDTIETELNKVNTTNNLKKTNDLKKTMEEVASVIGSPEITTAIEVLKALKAETSTTISDKVDQFGFTMINSILDHSYGAVWIDNIGTLISGWLSGLEFNNLPEKYKTVISQALKEYAISIADEPYKKQKYDLSFNDGIGHLFMLMISFEPHPTRMNAIKWERMLLQSDFKPAPSYVIVTESDCNILSCDRTDTIVYLPVVLNDAHTHSLINMNLGFLGEIDKKSKLIAH